MLETTTDLTPIAAGSDNPALEAARAEMKDIATNHSNPRHHGYHRGDPSVSSYLDNLYRQAVPATTPPAPAADDLARPPAQGEPIDSSLTREERVAQTATDTMLRQTLGEGYDTEMRDMGVAARHLFGSERGKAALDVLADAISDLGPLAEVRGVRFLAELGRDLVAQKRGR